MTPPDLYRVLLKKISEKFYSHRADRNWFRDQGALIKAIGRYAQVCVDRGWEPDLDEVFQDIMRLLNQLEQQEREGNGSRTWFPTYLQGCIDRRVRLQAEQLNRRKEQGARHVSKIIAGVQPVAEIRRTPIEETAALAASIKLKGGRKKKGGAKKGGASVPASQPQQTLF